MARREAFGAYYFQVEITGIPCFFRSCSGLKSETEVQEIAEGGQNSATHKLMGVTKFPNIVLKQGISGPELFNFRKKFVNDDGVIKQRLASITIKQLGPGGQAVAKWIAKDCWVCKWEGPDFDASKNEISIESLEIAHEGLDQG